MREGDHHVRHNHRNLDKKGHGLAGRGYGIRGFRVFLGMAGVDMKIKLTKRQYETLQPMFDLAVQAANRGKKGMILMQPRIFDAGEPCMDVVVDFIENERAKKIAEAMSK